MKRKIEYRTFPWRLRPDVAAIRAEDSPYPDMDGDRVVQGVAAVYDQEISIFGFWESIAPGAFGPSLTGGDILSLYHHDWGNILGRQSNDTLRLRDQADGLYTSNDLPDTQLGRDVYALIQRGDVQGMSVGMIVEKDTWTYDKSDDGDSDDGDKDKRRILRANLVEQTFTPIPAYPQTSVQIARSYVPIPPRKIAAFRRMGLSGMEREARYADYLYNNHNDRRDQTS